MKTNSLKTLGCTFTLALGLASLARAEEGGSGHYLPGAIASFVDGTPTAPTFVARYDFIYYDGSISIPIPLAGVTPPPANV